MLLRGDDGALPDVSALDSGAEDGPTPHDEADEAPLDSDSRADERGLRGGKARTRRALPSAVLLGEATVPVGRGVAELVGFWSVGQHPSAWPGLAWLSFGGSGCGGKGSVGYGCGCRCGVPSVGASGDGALSSEAVRGTFFFLAFLPPLSSLFARPVAVIAGKAAGKAGGSSSRGSWASLFGVLRGLPWCAAGSDLNLGFSIFTSPGLFFALAFFGLAGDFAGGVAGATTDCMGGSTTSVDRTREPGGRIGELAGTREAVEVGMAGARALLDQKVVSCPKLDPKNQGTPSPLVKTRDWDSSQSLAKKWRKFDVSPGLDSPHV